MKNTLDLLSAILEKTNHLLPIISLKGG